MENSKLEGKKYSIIQNHRSDRKDILNYLHILKNIGTLTGIPKEIESFVQPEDTFVCRLFLEPVELMMVASKPNKGYSIHRTIRYIFLTTCFVVVSAIFLYSGYQLQEVETPATDNVVKRLWRSVGAEDAYVFSAYYKPFEHTVEMVGIVKKTKVKLAFYCLFSVREGGNSSYRYSAALENVDHPPEYISFQTVYIRCTIPLAITPSIVTLEMNRNYTTLPIIYTKTKNLYNLSVCFPSFFRNYSDYGRLVEAVESNILFGVQFFTAYKHSVTDEVDKVFDYYVERGLMEVIYWNKPGGKLHHDGQWSHIQDCHLSHRYRSEYVMVIDVDELIVPHKHRHIIDLIRDLEKKDTFSPGSYTFRHAFFDVDNDKDTSTYPQKQQVEQLNIASLKHVWRTNKFQPPTERVKSIHVPPRVVTAGIHYTMKMVAGFNIHIVDPNLAYLHHYRRKLQFSTERKTKDAYMRKYTSELVLNVKHVYTMLGFSK